MAFFNQSLTKSCRRSVYGVLFLSSLSFAEATLENKAADTKTEDKAADKSKKETAKEKKAEQITVTGSRILRSSNYTNKQPTQTLETTTLQELGRQNVGEALILIPANALKTPDTTGNSNFFSGSYLANLRGLNPFIGTRTLVLLDTKRHVPTTTGDAIDLNMFPMILAERVETVTGGASAVYGSGAIGGVINVILDRDLRGGKANINYKRTMAGDGAVMSYGVAYGLEVAGGNLVFAHEGEKQDAISGCAGRKWCEKGRTTELNVNYVKNVEPQWVGVEGARDPISTSGVFPTLNKKVAADGVTVSEYKPGGTYGQGGEGRPKFPSNMRPNLSRNIFFAAYDKDITDDLNLKAELSYGKTNSAYDQVPTAWSSDLMSALVTNKALAADNFYLNKLDANPCKGLKTPCLASKDFGKEITPGNRTSADVQRVMVDLNGTINDDNNWTWDAYVQQGKSTRTQQALGWVHADRLLLALDAIDDGTGKPACRATLKGLNPKSTVNPLHVAGCVPLSLFGANTLSAAAKEYSYGRLYDTTTVSQTVMEASTASDIYEGFGAGSVKGVVGGSSRSDTLSVTTDLSEPEHIRKDYNGRWGDEYSGKVDVTELFGEVDVPAHEMIDIRTALRKSKYINTAGFGSIAEGKTFDYNLNAWTLNANVKPMSLLKFRASLSQDVRAPNMRELYFKNTLPKGSFFGYCSNLWTNNLNKGNGTGTGDACETTNAGSLDLKPEIALTRTVGMVMTPEDWKLQVAVDYYNTEIKDAIAVINSISLCKDGDLAACSLITGTLIDPNNPIGGFSKIDAVKNIQKNFGHYRTKGFDISSSWGDKFSFGDLSLSLVMNRNIAQTMTYLVGSTVIKRNLEGAIGGTGALNGKPQPAWSGNIIGGYTAGALTLTTAGRFVPPSKAAATLKGPSDAGYVAGTLDTIDNNKMPGYMVVNQGVSYNLQGVMDHMDLKLLLSIDNLFDKDPPLGAPTHSSLAFGEGGNGTNSTYYDVLGRRFSIGLSSVF